ncbi:MAG: PspC domain-containing protein [Silvibacterium sp.]
MNDGARFCSACGARLYVAAPVDPGFASGVNAGGWAGHTRLIRPRAGRMAAGVCQGLAISYGWDVVWVRVITVLLAIFGGGVGIVGYVIFWIVMPEEPLLLPSGTTYVPPSQG